MSKNNRNVLMFKFPFSSTYGGGEKHTITLVENLREKHNFYLVSTCSVLVPEFKKRKWNVEEIWAGTEPVTARALLLFFFTSPYILLSLLHTLLKYRRKHNVDTLYCLSLTEKVLLTPWARLLGIHVIWVEHLQIERWLLKSPLRFLYILWSRFATIVTVVNAVKEQLMNIGVPESSITVIYNSVNVQSFTPHPTDPERIRSAFNIVFIGRLAKEKGIDDLLRAIEPLRSRIPHLHLNIVGQGKWKDGLTQMIQDMDLTKHVTLRGFQDDVHTWLANSDVLVLPSTRRETFGIVLAEALATLTPVVATKVSGIPEVVGKYGWLVEPEHPEQIAAALQDVYDNYIHAIERTKQGRLRVLELFREDRMISEYDSLLVQNS